MFMLMLSLIFMNYMLMFFFSGNFSQKGSIKISCFIMLIVLILSLMNFIEVSVLGFVSEMWYFKWVSLNTFFMDFKISNEILSSMMFLIIYSISFMVHLYSTFYVSEDPNKSMFLSYLSLFTFLMVILVSSSNLMILFMGWEGVGVCSYLLISFWYQSNLAMKSALKAVLMNSMGDMGFMIFSILIINYMDSLNFFLIKVLFSNNKFMCNLILINIIMAMAGKSSQFGLHSWLPDAMEGPTPVSALIHAATMVTAGMFLIMKLSFFFSLSSVFSLVLLFLGSITALFGSSVGIQQNDFKKIMAYSTCSQLGFMVIICGLLEFSLGIFHLFNHAFFKALLFLSAGLVMHSLLDDQDLSKGGNLIYSNPLSVVFFILGSFSLMGLPFFSGFYSKDLILELANSFFFLGYIYWVSLISTLFTSFYSFKMMISGLLSEFKGSFLNNFFFLGNKMLFNLILFNLMMFSITMGYFSVSFFNLDLVPELNFFSKEIPFLLTLLGLLMSIFFCYKKKMVLKNFSMFLSNSWNIDFLFNKIFSSSILKLGFFFYHKIDSQMIEFLGPSNLEFYSKIYSSKINFFITGFLFNYLIMMMFFLSVLMLIL